ncbi:Ig-like domain-containing protein [Paenibacillus sp. JSM ZJ436]|uniref:Ig-like domain-containing protein n=1 Tax=Paenibacillus sp. JSM ZJ436 TaxID=3376190 RepID=UPI0037A7DD47
MGNSWRIRNAQPALTVTDVTYIPDIYVSFGTRKEGLGLPRTIEITLEDHSVTDAPVAWNGGTPIYDPAAAGVYLFEGTLDLPAGIHNPNQVTAEAKVILKERVPDDVITGLVLDQSSYRLQTGQTHSTVTKAVYSSGRQEALGEGSCSRRVDYPVTGNKN